MFTGIVAHQGRVRRATTRNGLLELRIDAGPLARELKRGDSIAVNGVCLTATESSRRSFKTEAMAETLARTTLGNLARGSIVNLELAARLADRLGGHLVQGHVDGLAEVIRVEDEERSRRVWLRTDNGLLDYMVAKGSVTLDGVSLTVVDVGQTSFQVALIPHTLDVTTLDRIEPGSTVNVEVDIIAKYVRHFVERN